MGDTQEWLDWVVWTIVWTSALIDLWGKAPGNGRRK
jgi:hypothetical protein